MTNNKASYVDYIVMFSLTVIAVWLSYLAYFAPDNEGAELANNTETSAQVIPIGTKYSEPMELSEVDKIKNELIESTRNRRNPSDKEKANYIVLAKSISQESNLIDVTNCNIEPASANSNSEEPIIFENKGSKAVRLTILENIYNIGPGKEYVFEEYPKFQLLTYQCSTGSSVATNIGWIVLD